jgi:acid phosphatase family membrane protein YuiD
MKRKYIKWAAYSTSTVSGGLLELFGYNTPLSEIGSVVVFSSIGAQSIDRFYENLKRHKFDLLNIMDCIGWPSSSGILIADLMNAVDFSSGIPRLYAAVASAFVTVGVIRRLSTIRKLPSFSPLSKSDVLFNELEEVSKNYKELSKKYQDVEIPKVESKNYDSVITKITPHIEPFLYSLDPEDVIKIEGKSLIAKGRADPVLKKVEIYGEEMPFSEFCHTWGHELFHIDGENESGCEFKSYHLLKSLDKQYPNTGCDLEAEYIKFRGYAHAYVYQRRLEIEGSLRERLKRKILRKNGTNAKDVITGDLKKLGLDEKDIKIILKLTYPKSWVKVLYFSQSIFEGDDMRGPYTIGLYRKMKESKENS